MIIYQLYSEAVLMESINILLVEDNKINQLMASTFLRKWGMKVTFANNGKEAVSSIQSKQFNIVLMDLQMPEMDGFESTSKIRCMDDSYFKTVPIIAFSASGIINSKEKALDFGMTDFINKPLNPEELKEKIETYTATAFKKGELSERP